MFPSVCLPFFLFSLLESKVFLHYSTTKTQHVDFCECSGSLGRWLCLGVVLGSVVTGFKMTLSLDSFAHFHSLLSSSSTFLLFSLSFSSFFLSQNVFNKIEIWINSWAQHWTTPPSLLQQHSGVRACIQMRIRQGNGGGKIRETIASGLEQETEGKTFLSPNEKWKFHVFHSFWPL